MNRMIVGVAGVAALTGLTAAPAHTTFPGNNGWQIVLSPSSRTARGRAPRVRSHVNSEKEK